MDREREFAQILGELQANGVVEQMKGYIQHGRVSTYEHCESVAWLSFRIDERLHLGSDLRVLAYGAMLHDFYLYDWHEDDGGSHRLHGFTHARRGRHNAQKYFGVDERIGHVIDAHMWPLNPERVPCSREAWIVCLSDKWVSLKETLFLRGERKENREDG